MEGVEIVVVTNLVESTSILFDQFLNNVSKNRISKARVLEQTNGAGKK